jgi:hypothetical protein
MTSSTICIDRHAEKTFPLKFMNEKKATELGTPLDTCLVTVPGLLLENNLKENHLTGTNIRIILAYFLN